MKRREFLQGALAVAAVALLPKAAQPPPDVLPGFTWSHSEEAGRRLMDRFVMGIDAHRGYITTDANVYLWHSDNGGRITWEATSVGFNLD